MASFAPHFCDDPLAPPITETCVLGCRWLVRVIDRDVNRNGDQYGCGALEDIARGLPLRALRMYRANDVLTHPPDELSPEEHAALTVGLIEGAWVKADRVVFATAHLWHSVTRLHRGLLALERRSRGHLIAGTRISLVLRARTHPQEPRQVVAVPAVLSVDLVTRPGCRDTGFVRSLAPGEELATVNPEEEEPVWA